MPAKSSTNGTAVHARLDQMQAALDEQHHTIQRLAAALGALVAQQYQPQMAQNITQNLLNPPPPPPEQVQAVPAESGPPA